LQDHGLSFYQKVGKELEIFSASRYGHVLIHEMEGHHEMSGYRSDGVLGYKPGS
jgi:hypothetical protein